MCCKDEMGVREPKRPDVEVTFPKSGEEGGDGDEGDVRTVTVGCVALADPKLGGNISFSVVPIDTSSETAKLFTATPASGSVAPGNEQDITFTFAPPTVEEEGGIEVGQWTYVDFELKSTGGWGEGERVWTVRVRGYINV